MTEAQEEMMNSNMLGGGTGGIRYPEIAQLEEKKIPGTQAQVLLEVYVCSEYSIGELLQKLCLSVSSTCLRLGTSTQSRI